MVRVSSKASDAAMKRLNEMANKKANPEVKGKDRMQMRGKTEPEDALAMHSNSAEKVMPANSGPLTNAQLAQFDKHMKEQEEIRKSYELGLFSEKQLAQACEQMAKDQKLIDATNTSMYYSPCCDTDTVLCHLIDVLKRPKEKERK
jgi:hypothetical protein